MDARITAEVFAVWTGGHPASIIDVSYRGAVAAGLPRNKLPGLASVDGVGCRTVPAAGFLIVAAHCNDSIVVINGEAKKPGGRLATGTGSVFDGPGMAQRG